MKQSVIQIKFETNKYNALVRYAKRKDVSVDDELSETMNRLYKKLVPSDVREFIEETVESEEKSKAKEKKEKAVVEEKSEENNHAGTQG